VRYISGGFPETQVLRNISDDFPEARGLRNISDGRMDLQGERTQPFVVRESLEETNVTPIFMLTE
jgi:hypothetical protein